MTNINITNFRKDIYELLEQTIKFNEPINITTKNGNAVVISEEDYNGLMETFIKCTRNERKTYKGKRNKNRRLCCRRRGGMVVYKIVYTKDSIKDIEKLKGANLNKKVLALIEIIKNNPFQTPPPYEKLVGDLQGLYSRRINIKHRLVYQILENVQTVKIVSMWTHYEKI